MRRLSAAMTNSLICFIERREGREGSIKEIDEAPVMAAATPLALLSNQREHFVRF